MDTSRIVPGWTLTKDACVMELSRLESVKDLRSIEYFLSPAAFPSGCVS
jgi:hypothetical protein